MLYLEPPGTSEAAQSATENDLGPAPEQVIPEDQDAENHEQSFVPLPDSTEDIRKEVENAVKRILGQDARTSSNAHTASIPWPTRGDTPLSEYTTRLFFSLAFPALFPKSQADFSMNRPRTCDSMDEWGKHLLNYHDGRFAQHPFFKFIVHNVIMRRQTAAKGRFVVKQTLGDSHMSVEDLRQILENDRETLTRKILYYSADLRGTSQYWAQRNKELKALVQWNITEGNGLPSIFVTASCAEFYWRPLIRLLSEFLGKPLLTKSEIYCAVRDNSHIVTHYFDLRTKSYFKLIMQKLFKVSCYWFRYEFAKSRGQIHFHGLCSHTKKVGTCNEHFVS